MNGESAEAPAGLVGVAVAALDLFFIELFAESLDFLTGDFFRILALAALALLAAGARFFAAGVVLALVFAFAFGAAFALVFALALGLAVALDFALAVAALGRAFALVFAAAFVLALGFAAGFFAAGFFLAAGFFFDALTLAFAVARAAAPVRGFFGDFVPDDAAMMFPWFLTREPCALLRRRREFEGRVSYQNPPTLTI